MSILYVYRAKLKALISSFNESLVDFDAALQINDHDYFGLIGKGDCLRKLGQAELAIQSYSSALSVSVSEK